MSPLRIVSLATVGALLAVTLGIAAILIFDAPQTPAPMPAISGTAARDIGRLPLPPLKRFTASDGVALAYRRYDPPKSAAGPWVAILIHGSGGSSGNMSIMGQALAQRGVASFAPDIRGHGASGARGDIAYRGQLEDDLNDLIALVKRAYPRSRLLLVGHSSGGGFALRIAGQPIGKQFSRIVLLAPYLGPMAPTTRPGSGGWVTTATGRIVAITVLNRVGIHAFDGLPTIAFATLRSRPTFWSYRLMENFGPSDIVHTRDRQGYRLDAARSMGPIVLFAGDGDEIMYATRYAAAFHAVKPPVEQRILRGVTHMGILTEPRSVDAILATLGS